MLGQVILFGSGETSPHGRRIFDQVFQQIGQPVTVSILETPAGFELNSKQVAGRVANFLEHNLQNHEPQVTLIPARKRGTANSPDNPEIIAPMQSAKVIYAGAGSPTYAVRQLRGSLAWHTLNACHRQGATVVFASAAVIAIGRRTLPIYEIYKAGDEPHWRRGLDFFGAFNLDLVFIPHWNNNEGGTELDTSHCFIGEKRFELLVKELPARTTVVGIDEHTAVGFDFGTGRCQVMGKGRVTLLRAGEARTYASKETFPLDHLGAFRLPGKQDSIPAGVLQAVARARRKAAPPPAITPPDEVLQLVNARENARKSRDWATADKLRGRISELGWQVVDTPSGPQMERLDHA